MTGLTGIEAGQFLSYDAVGGAEIFEAPDGSYNVRVAISASGDIPTFFAFAHVEVRGDGA